MENVNPMAIALATTLAGVFSTLITNPAKTYLGLSGRSVVWLNYIISLLSAFVALWVTGGIHISGDDPATIVASIFMAGTAAAGIAEKIYQHRRTGSKG